MELEFKILLVKFFIFYFYKNIIKNDNIKILILYSFNMVWTY